MGNSLGMCKCQKQSAALGSDATGEPALAQHALVISTQLSLPFPPTGMTLVLPLVPCLLNGHVTEVDSQHHRHEPVEADTHHDTPT